METNEVNYVGRRVRGLRFTPYVGLIGKIISEDEDFFIAKFPNGRMYPYPKKEAISHLVEEPTQTKEEKPAEQKPLSLDLKRFREVSTRRAQEGFKTYDNVPITFWTTAIAGELGELCNMIKKLERAKVGGLNSGHTKKVEDISTDDLAEEIGGVFIYLDLLASRLGIDLEQAVIKTFNDKSDEHGLERY